jgi:hypothetical protein
MFPHSTSTEGEGDMAEIFKTTIASHITMNGKKYASIDEMPPDVRRQYEQSMQSMMVDKDHNGIPDILEHPPTPGNAMSSNVQTTKRIMVNGRSYDRIEDVPPQFREAIMRALSGKPPKTIVRTPFFETDSSSLTKWFLFLAALLAAGAVGWLMHK